MSQHLRAATHLLVAYVITPVLSALLLGRGMHRRLPGRHGSIGHHVCRSWLACKGHAVPCLTGVRHAERQVTCTPGRPTRRPAPCAAAAQPGALVRAGAASAPLTPAASVRHPEGRPWLPAGAAKPGQAGGAGLRPPGGCVSGGSAACTTEEDGGAITGGLQAMDSHLGLAHMGSVVLQRGMTSDGSMPEGMLVGSVSCKPLAVTQSCASADTESWIRKPSSSRLEASLQKTADNHQNRRKLAELQIWTFSEPGDSAWQPFCGSPCMAKSH